MPKTILKRSAIVVGLVAAGLTVASCMTATPYQPATGSGSQRNGYWDQQIDSTHFRITFAGNSLTSRETVERYLLYRAAELTTQAGFDNFTLVDRHTQTKSHTYVDSAFGPGPFGYWHPYWRFYRPRFGWRYANPFFGDPFWNDDFDVTTVERFEASAEIAVGHGPKPNNVRAFDAHEVLSRLGSKIELPKPK